MSNHHLNSHKLTELLQIEIFIGNKMIQPSSLICYALETGEREGEEGGRDLIMEHY